MKLGPGSPGDTPSMVSIPHSLTWLSPVRIASMSEKELQDVLPQLVAILQKGFLVKRPDWWPHSTIPWTLQNIPMSVKNANASSLRNLVHKCYSCLAQYSLKSGSTHPKVPTQPRVLDWLNSNPISRSCTQPAKSSAGANPNQKGGVPYLEIYLCYQCNQEFSTKDTLQKHQVKCSNSTLPLSIPSTPPASEAPSPVAPTVASDDTSSSGGATSASVHPSSHATLSRSDFVAALDLVPVQKARKIRMARRRNTECETIDLEEPQTPISPTTPRTPKLLISQLSRDASFSGGNSGSGGATSRRRLSYLRQSVEKRPDRLPAEGKDTGEENSDSDGDSSNESSADDADEPKLLKKSLFMIDVSSGLGQRVLKHMTSEAHVPVIADSEQYCRTPIKDKYQDRLRTRQVNYPITWKLTRKRLRQHTHCHLYNFTRAQKIEFMEKMRTGLNFECRKLLSQIRGCSVVVKRLSTKTLYKWKPSLNKITVPLKPLTELEIKYWTQPKPSSPQPSVFPDGPTLLCADLDRVLGLRRKGGSPEVARKLLAGHCVSETANAELQLQKLTVYRSLLADLSSSASKRLSSTSKPTASTKKEKDFPTLFSILSTSSPSKVPNRSKGMSSQASEDVKKPLKIMIPSSPLELRPSVARSNRSSPLDDSFSIMTVSSDEDNNKSNVCCSLCAVRNKCRCSPGKASASVARSSSSPRPTAKLSFSCPPSQSHVSSPSITPRMSVLPQSTLSPPNLSPVSLGSESCQPSPASSWRLCTRSSTVSPNKISPSSRSKSPAVFPETSLGHVNRSKSPSARSPGKGSEWSRNVRDTRGQTLKSAGSRDPLQPLLATLRPNTRSGTRDSLTGKSAAKLVRRKTASAPVDTRRKEPLVCANSTLLKVKSLSPRLESRLTRSSTNSGEKCAGCCQETSSGEAGHTPRLRAGHSGRSSSAGNQKTVEKRSGQNSRSNSNSSDRNQRAVTKRSVAGDSAVRSLRNAQPGTGGPETDSKAGTVVFGDSLASRNMNGQLAHSDNNGVSVRRSARANPFASTSEERKPENNVEAVNSRGTKRTAAETSAVPSRAQDEGSGNISNKTIVSASPSLSPNSNLSPNPFLISKAQTPLFSSSIMEQARRHWRGSPKSPTQEGGKGLLRSGNTFRMGSMVLGSPSCSFSSSPSPQGGGSAALSASLPLFSQQCRRTCDASCSPRSPNQIVPLTHVGHRERKRLSPMQMLSVLESAKCRGSASRARSPAGSPRQRSLTSQQKLYGVWNRMRGKRSAYPTRAKETSSAAKKARFG